MMYVVDRIIDNIVVLEDLNNKEILEVDKALLPRNITDGTVLDYIDGKYLYNIDEENLRRQRIREKMERLKRLKK